MDLNADGHDDIITGQYHPGEITWFRGTGEGFLPGIHLEQEGDPAANGNPQFGNYDGEPGDIGTFTYWNYSTPSFGDIDGDGDHDLIVGGFDSIRISENVGSATEPKFAQRKPLLDVNGGPLCTMVASEETIARYQQRGSGSPTTIKASPFVVDWNSDGVLDLLVTDSYTSAEHMAVTFFRGVRTQDQIRFEPGVDLLRTSDGSKALPGSCHRVTVADWNNDGINDLIIGASVATVNGGVFSDELSWEWESVTQVQSAGKDPGRYDPQPRPTVENMKERFGDRLSDERIEAMFGATLQHWEDTIGRLYKEGKDYYLTMRHQGRVYVMLGQPAGDNVRGPAGRVDRSTTGASGGTASTPSAPVVVTTAKTVQAAAGGIVGLSVRFDVRDGWFIYAPTGSNTPRGMRETEIAFTLPAGFTVKGSAQSPPPIPMGPFEILEGPDVRFVQPVTIASNVSPGAYTVRGQVTFQTCNKDMCLPPHTTDVSITINVAAP